MAFRFRTEFLERAKEMRSFQKVSESLAALGKDIQDAWKAFIDITEEDEMGDAAAKVADKIELRLWYFILDYWLAALFGALVVGMIAWGFSTLTIFFTGWAFDFVVAMYFVVHERVFGTDISMGSDSRRAMDVLKKRRKTVWGFSLLGILLKASVWDGPESIVMFFRKEINTWLRVAGIIAFLAAAQAAFWQLLWTLGYDVLVESENSPGYIAVAAILVYGNQVRKYFGRSL